MIFVSSLISFSHTYPANTLSAVAPQQLGRPLGHIIEEVGGAVGELGRPDVEDVVVAEWIEDGEGDFAEGVVGGHGGRHHRALALVQAVRHTGHSGD